MCQEKWAKELDRALFPGVQGGRLMHVIAAKAVAFKEALGPDFSAYQRQIVANAKALAATLMDEGFRLVSGGTDNHLMLVDVFARGITGKEAEAALDHAGITVNKNTIPFDTNKPMTASGIRIGTPALTTRGMREADMETVGRLIARVLKDHKSESALADVRRDVTKLCGKFPLYASRLQAYDRALARA
jgi:glycine hydroxymethyltransferase